MIFPNLLPNVTFYNPVTDRYYELDVSTANMKFEMEQHYSVESLSARKIVKTRGLRFSVDLVFSQTGQHDVMRDLLNEICQYPSIKLYLTKESDIEEGVDSLDILSTSFSADLNYGNQIRRHGYSLSFTGYIVDSKVGTFFVVDNLGVFILTNDGSKITVDVNIY